MDKKVNHDKKIYCKQCEYYLSHDYNYNHDICNIPYYKSTFLSKETVLWYRGECKSLNKNNDCQEFLIYKKFHFWNKWFNKSIRKSIYRIKEYEPFTKPKLVIAMKQILREDEE